MRKNPNAATRRTSGPKTLPGIVFTGLLTLAGAASAEPLCNTLAEEFSANPEDYFQLNHAEVEPTDPAIFEQLTMLAGDWDGHSSEINCKGRPPLSKAQASDFEVEATIDQNWRGELSMKAEKEQQRVLKLEQIWLTPELASNREHRHMRTLSERTVQQGDNGVVVRHKYRARNGGLGAGLTPVNRAVCLYGGELADCRSTRLVDEVKTLSWTENTLSIQRDTYVNGQFVSRQDWQLNRL